MPAIKGLKYKKDVKLMLKDVKKDVKFYFPVSVAILLM